MSLTFGGTPLSRGGARLIHTGVTPPPDPDPGPGTGDGSVSDSSLWPIYSAYTGNIDHGPPGIPVHEQWLGRTVEMTHDMTPQDSWENLENAEWQIDIWKIRQHHLYSVGMWPWGSNVNDGAAGAYDFHWTNFATRTLLPYNITHWPIRLGWEFNGNWFPWSAQGNPTAWAEYWRRIVTTIRAVPGCEDVKFVFCPIYGYQGWPAFDARTAYPGDDYVDFIGIDIYDEAWDPVPRGTTNPEARWNHFLNGPLMIQDWLDFCAAHNKPMCFPEWGLNIHPPGRLINDGSTYQPGGGDNPRFIQGMYDIISNPANNVAFHSYFDVEAGDGYHGLSTPITSFESLDATRDNNYRRNLGPNTLFPQSAALYKTLFGA